MKRMIVASLILAVLLSLASPAEAKQPKPCKGKSKEHNKHCQPAPVYSGPCFPICDPWQPCPMGSVPCNELQLIIKLK